ncbi:hypothetical protein ANCDUO_20466, partial [Ancylostoma duodenale]
ASHSSIVHYFLYHEDESHSRRRKRAAVQRLDSHPAVEWLAEQRPRRRTKRDYIHNDEQVVEMRRVVFRDHPDLITNYDPLASTDINDHDDDPTPQNNGDNKHGTRCAGEVAAIAGNNHCGVGVAFKAKIGGVRMLDGAVSDSVEAASLSLNQ